MIEPLYVNDNALGTWHLDMVIIIINCKWVFTRWQWYNNKTTDKQHAYYNKTTQYKHIQQQTHTTNTINKYSKYKQPQQIKSLTLLVESRGLKIIISYPSHALGHLKASACSFSIEAHVSCFPQDCGEMSDWCTIFGRDHFLRRRFQIVIH
jgi:hypothetical protein